MRLNSIEELKLLLGSRPSHLLVCDLDGVIFDHRWRDFLIPVDPSKDSNWDLWCQAAIKDSGIQNNINLVGNHTNKIFLTSRSVKYEELTIDKLTEHFGSGVQLLMRPEGVNTAPTELKVKQLKENCVEPNEEFFFVDDSEENVLAVDNAFPKAITFLMPY